MANYRYLCTDLLTNTVIAELPLTGVTYAQSLNDAGEFNGQLLLSDSRIAGTLGSGSIDLSTTPARTGIYVERDGVIVYGGVIWSRTYNSTSATMTLAAREFESYFGRRRIADTTVFGPNVDQFVAVKTLIDNAQAAAYGNIQIDTSGIGTCGVNLPNVLAIYGYEKRNLLDVIQDLAKQEPPYGFDFHVDVSYGVDNVLRRAFVLSYPHKGIDYATNQFAPMLEFPGSIVAYTYPESGGTLVNTLYGFGAGSSDSQYVSSQSSGASFANGFPLLEDVQSFSQIPDPRIVDNLTRAQVAARDKPVVVMEARWVPQVDAVTGAPTAPNPTEINIGDQVRIRIKDDRFTEQVDTVLRVVKTSVRVGDDGSAELITGSFVPITY
mgnify:FL=1